MDVKRNHGAGMKRNSAHMVFHAIFLKGISNSAAAAVPVLDRYWRWSGHWARGAVMSIGSDRPNPTRTEPLLDHSSARALS